MKLLYVITIPFLITTISILLLKVDDSERIIYLILCLIILFIPGRISQIFYQDLYTGRKYSNAMNFDKALEYFLKFEKNIENNKWKKIFLWMTLPIYTTDVMAMVKFNIGSIYINMGKIDEGEKYTKDAIYTDKKYPLPYLNLALINKLKNNEDEYLRNIKEAKQLGMKGSKIDKAINGIQAFYANIQSVEK